jgi:hypothetical protein
MTDFRKIFLKCLAFRRAFLSLIAVLAVNPASAAQVIAPAGEVVSFCQSFLGGMASSSKKEQFLALAKKLIEADAVEDSAWEALLASPEPLSLLEFGYQRLSTQELSAYKAGFDLIFRGLDRKSFPWEEVKSLIQTIRGASLENRIRQKEAQKKTKAIFAPLFLKTFNNAGSLVGTDPNEKPIFTMLPLVASAKTADRWNFVPETGDKYPAARPGTAVFQKLRDGTLMESFLLEGQMWLRNVYSGHEFKMSLRDLGFPEMSRPHVIFFKNNAGRPVAVLWLNDPKNYATRVTRLDLTTSSPQRTFVHGDRAVITVDESGETYSIGHDAQGRVYLNDKLPSTPVRMMKLFTNPAGEIPLNLPSDGSLLVKTAPSGKRYLLSVKDAELTVVDLTTRAIKAFENVHVQRPNGALLNLIDDPFETPNGDIYLITRNYNAGGPAGVSVFNLSQMTAFDFEMPSEKPLRLDKRLTQVRPVHLSDGQTLLIGALTTMDPFDRYIEHLFIHPLGKTGETFGFSVKGLGLQTFEFIRAVKEGGEKSEAPADRIEGFFKTSSGVSLFQLYGPVP